MVNILAEIKAVDEQEQEPIGECKKTVRTKGEIRRIKQKIVQLAKVWAEQFIEVLPGDWWKCTFKNSGELIKKVTAFIKGEIDTLDDLPDEFFKAEQILYPEEKLFEETEDEIDGKINHEAGHALFTDFRNWFKVQRKAKDEGYLPTSASGILNTVEDPRVNSLQIGISDHKRRKFEAVYGPWIENHKKIMDKLSPPEAVQILLIAKWVQEKLGIITLREFEEMFNKANPKAQEYFNKLINSSRNYWNESDSQIANQIFGNEIWPIYKELEEKGIEHEITEEILREAIKRMKEAIHSGEKSDKGDSGGQSIQIPFDKLPKDLQDEIKDLLKEQAKKQSGQKQGEEKQQGDQSQASSSSSSSSSSESEKQDSQSQNSSSDSSESISDSTSESADQAASGTPSENNLPNVPEDLKNRINKSLNDNLSDQEKEDLKKEARKNLDKKQAEKLNEEGLPNGQKMEFDPETGEYLPTAESATEKEVNEAKEKVEEIKKQQEEDQKKREELKEKIENAEKPEDIDKILEDKEDFPDQFKNEITKAAEAKKELLQKKRESKIKEMKKDGFMEKDAKDINPYEEQLYDEYKAYENAVKNKVNSFVESIMPHIPRKQIIEYGDHVVRSGTELENEVLGDFGTRKQGYVFKNQEIVEQGDPRMFITFLVDRSGSMAGEKLDESMKTLIFFAMVFKEIGRQSQRNIDFSIKFFNDAVADAKNFDDDFDDPKRIKWKDGTSSTVKKRMMVESKKSGNTDMGLGILSSNEDLNKRKKQYPNYLSCLFVISDGETFGALKEERLTRFIKGLEQYYGQRMGKHLKAGFYLRGGENLSEFEKAAETPMEKYFGKRGEGTVVVDNFKALVPEAEKVLRKTLIKMASRLFK